MYRIGKLSDMTIRLGNILEKFDGLERFILGDQLVVRETDEVIYCLHAYFLRNILADNWSALTPQPDEVIEKYYSELYANKSTMYILDNNCIIGDGVVVFMDKEENFIIQNRHNWNHFKLPKKYVMTLVRGSLI